MSMCVYLICVLVVLKGTAALECYSCNNIDTIAKCQHITTCRGKQSCFTSTKEVGGNITYTMGCTVNENCGSIPVYEKISEGSPNEKCYDCCGNDRCNNLLCKHPKPVHCINDPKLDCAYWNNRLNICENIHQAKKICKRFCKLCALVDGNWAEWSRWSGCDVTCGHGKYTRSRTCTNPAPAYQGLDCEGASYDTKPCVRPLCPVHGGWSQWSNWGGCPVTCGIGIQKRYRNCTNPVPIKYGDHCFGDSTDVKICLQGTCTSKDGGWTNWGNWSSCSATCDAGLRKRSRSCSNPTPDLRGRFCDGDPMQVEMCNEKACPCNTPPSVLNGVVRVKKEADSKYNKSFFVECNAGFELKNISTYIECTKNGEWYNIPTCTPVNCGAVGTLKNGRIVFTSGSTFQTVSLFECNQGALMVGNPLVSCKEDGFWTQLPKCKPRVPLTSCSGIHNYNSSFTNVALGKQVELSSLLAHYRGQLMVDGNNSTFMHTLHSSRPYATVDLLKTYTIYTLYIVNRQGYTARLHDVMVFIGDDPFRLDIVARHKSAIGTDCTFRFNEPYRGRFVKIQLEATESLHIAELNVYSII